MEASAIAEAFDVSPFKANLALLVIRGRVSVESHPGRFKSTNEWIDRCHHRPRKSEIKMEALSELLGGYGVEAIESDAYIDSFYGNFIAEYINLGDSYATTIVLCHERSVFKLTSAGDYIERMGL